MFFFSFEHFQTGFQKFQTCSTIFKFYLRNKRLQFRRRRLGSAKLPEHHRTRHRRFRWHHRGELRIRVWKSFSRNGVFTILELTRENTSRSRWISCLHRRRIHRHSGRRHAIMAIRLHKIEHGGLSVFRETILRLWRATVRRSERYVVPTDSAIRRQK